MRKFYILFIVLIFMSSLMAQVPQSFKYQAIARDAGGNVVTDQAVGMRISILKSSISGTAVYVETFKTTTNKFGLINLNIGEGTVVSGDITTIDWSADTYFIKVEMDITGGTAYEEYGTSQLLSVPYALHAKTAENTFSGSYNDLSDAPVNVSTFTNDAGYLTSFTETDPVFGAHVTNGITLTNITNWTTAYSWGDHSIAGYLTSFNESDPLFSAWDKSTGISITESQIIDLDHFTTVDETDPVFSAWDKSTGISITESQIADLDHFTTVDETDPVFDAWDKSTGISITESQITDLDHFTTMDETDPLFRDLFNITSSANNQLLKYNSTSGKWENWTANFLTTEVDGDLSNEIQNLSEVLAEGNSANARIKNVTDPADDQDAATKAYVDKKFNQILALQGVTDIDGNHYDAVLIGDQIWMAENLKTTHFANGDAIPNGTGVGDISLETDPEYWFAYNDNLSNVSIYGRLYTAYAIADSRNVCPDGWHVSTDTEWAILTNYLGGENQTGAKLKETGTIHWNSPNEGATNETGFTALPGGRRSANGSFTSIGNYGSWWSPIESPTSYDWIRELHYTSTYIYRYYPSKKDGHSVRCLRD
jgi:uncharacterized protein (TIGR02145 family)